MTDSELLLRLTNGLKKLRELIQDLEHTSSTTNTKTEILEKLKDSELIQQKWINELSSKVSN